jgi:hypothetical protein
MTEQEMRKELDKRLLGGVEKALNKTGNITKEEYDNLWRVVWGEVLELKKKNDTKENCLNCNPTGKEVLGECLTCGGDGYL